MFHCCDSSPRAWSRWLLLQLPGPWPKDRSKWVPGTWSSQLRFTDGLEGLAVTPLRGVTARAPSIPTNGRTEETLDRGTAVAIKARRTPGLSSHLLPWSNSRGPHKLQRQWRERGEELGALELLQLLRRVAPPPVVELFREVVGFAVAAAVEAAAPLLPFLGAWFIPALRRSSSSGI